MERTFFKWLWDERKWMILCILVIATLSIWAAYYTNHDCLSFNDLDSWWGKWFEMPIVLGTFIFSFFIARRTLLTEWDNSLPKRLTVHFVHDNKYIMTCHEAYLSGEDDIRQWGQQIGFQMTGGQKIDFEPWINSHKEPRNGKTYNHYIVTFIFREIPNGDHRLLSCYKIWFKKNGGNSLERDEEIIEKHPNHFYSIVEALKHRNKNIEIKNCQKMVDFKVNILQDYAIISFTINDSFSPAEIKSLVPPDSIKLNFASKGVILSGRGPLWLYGFLIHFYHPTKFVATYDPRLNGAVVVESHYPEYKIGDVIKVDLNNISMVDL